MRFLRKYLLQNLHLKAGSLVLAVLLWSAIANQPRVEVVFQSPLEFQNMPQELELSMEAPTTVQVRVAGPASAVRPLSGADLGVTLDVAGFDRPGERTYPLTVSEMRVPLGVRVTQIIPAQVRVRFEARSRRNVPVIPRIVGAVAPGYQLAAYHVSPPAVTIVGPQSHVSVIESASTDPVDVTGMIARSQAWTSAFVPDPLVRIENNQTVRVTIQMKKQY